MSQSLSHATHDVESQHPGPAPTVHATLRLFAAARQQAGTGRVDVVGTTVGDVVDWARREYGAAFSAVVDTSRVWCNGEPAEARTVLADGDEVAVLPPVSGGAGPGPEGGGPAPVRP